MTNLKILEKNEKRVLTTAQLAEVYGTDYKSISKNYARNKDRYIEGKHYFLLKGEERSDFLDNYRQNDDSLKHAKHIFLWTDKGALLHAKSLGTDEAWNAYSDLVDDYFSKVELIQRMNVPSPIPTTIEGILELAVLNMKDLRTQINEVKQQNDHLQLVVDNEIVLTKQQRGSIRNAVLARQGALNAEGYTQKHFQAIYRAVNQHFGVAEYADINRTDFDRAMKIIQGWYPKKAEE
jgi:hypothetical protein